MREVYTPRNPQKYKGGPIVLKSRWEVVFAQWCDMNANVLEWAYEPAKIPYNNPSKPPGKQSSIYEPDFLIALLKPNKSIIKALVEVKPMKEALEEASRSKLDKLARIVNEAKWMAAKLWCQRRGIEFWTVTEEQLFGARKPKSKAPPKSKKPKK